MRVVRPAVCFSSLIFFVVLVGCGGSSSSSNNNHNTPLTVTTTSTQLSTGVVNTAYPATSLAASGGTAPYAWSISTGALPSGLTLNAGTGAITGTPTTSGTANFTAKVTDSSTPQQSATANLSITVNPGALTITTASLPNGNLGTAYSTTVAASGGVQPYTWSITSGGLPTGLSIGASTGTISGTPTATGTFSFTVTATDSQSAHANANLSIVINSAASCTNNANLNAQYAIALEGWTNAGTGEVLFAGVGSFVADGAGNISSGLMDTNDPSNGPQSGSFTGTYCVGSNNLGTMTLTTAAGSATLAFALQSSGNGHIISYDTGMTQASGVFTKQDTTSFATNKFTGNYSLSMTGVDPASGNRIGVVGAFTANGTSSLTNGEMDRNVVGTLTNTTFASTDFTVGANGRGTVGLNVTGLGTLNYTFYVVNTTQIVLVASDSGTLGLLTGQMTKQSGLTGTSADLNGVSVLSTQGLKGGTTPGVDVALLATDGAGSFTAAGTQNHGGTVTAFSPASGTYTVATNGRVTVDSGGNTIAILYLTAKNGGVILDTNNAVDSGLVAPQAKVTFSTSSLTGNYYGGSRPPVLPSVDEEIDNLNASSGAATITTQTNSTQGNGSGSPSNNSLSGTYNIASDGSGTLLQGGNQIGVIYMVSSSNFVFLDTTASNPKVVGYQH